MADYGQMGAGGAPPGFYPEDPYNDGGSGTSAAAPPVDEPAPYDAVNRARAEERFEHYRGGGDPTLPPPDAQQGPSQFEPPKVEPPPAPDEPAVEAPAVGGGYRMPRIELQGVQMYDDQLAKLEGDFNARLRRVLDDPSMPPDIKAQTVARMRADYSVQQAEVNAKRSAFLKTSEGMGERIAQLGLEGEQAKIQHAADVSQLEGDTARARVDLVAEQQKQRQAQHQAEQQEREAIRGEVSAAEGAYRKGISEYNAMAADKSAGKLTTGESVLGGLGLALGALATMVGGGPEHQATINATLERAVEAKMAEHQRRLQNKRASLADQRDLIGVVRAQYADAEQGWAAARLALQEQAIAEVEQLRGTAAGKRAGVDFDANVDALKRSAEQGRVMLHKSAVDLYNAKRAGAAAAAQAERARRQKAAMVQMYGQQLSEKDEDRLIPGAGLALKGTDIKVARDEYAQVTNTKQLFARVQGVLRKAKGGQVLSNTDKETLNLFRSQIATPTMQELYGAGNEEQFAHAAAVAGVPTMDWTERNWVDMERLVGTGKSLADAKHQNWVDRNVDRGATLSYTDPETGRTVWHFKRGAQGGGANIRPGVAR